MLSERKIARSYSTALFGLALEYGRLEEIWRDIGFIEALLKENPELVKVLASPVIRTRKKSDIVDVLLKEHVDELTLRFLHLLVKSLRVLYLLEITDEFRIQYKAHHGIVRVHLKTAHPVDDEIRKKITEKLVVDLKARIELEEVTDSRLIGGFVLQVDDRRFDASVRSKLNKLDRQFDINIYKKGF